VSLHGRRVEQAVELPDGREGVVLVGVPGDSYIPKRELDTVSLELVIDDRVEATVNTVLDPEQEAEALDLAREAAAALHAGEVEPTAAALEPLATALR
jgi:hypothetical protein